MPAAFGLLPQPNVQEVPVSDQLFPQEALDDAEDFTNNGLDFMMDSYKNEDEEKETGNAAETTPADDGYNHPNPSDENDGGYDTDPISDEEGGEHYPAEGDDTALEGDPMFDGRNTNRDVLKHL